MSHIVKQGDREQFNSLTKKALDVTLLMAVPLSIYFCLFARDSVLLLAGEGFLGAVLAMQIITVAVIPNGLTGVLGVQVLTSLEKEKFVLYSVVVGAVSDLVLNLVFIPTYGAAGAAFATMIAEFLVLFVQLYYTRDILASMVKKLRLPFYALATVAASLISLPVMSVMGVGSAFIRLCISAILFFGVYGILLLVCKEPILMQYLDKFKSMLKRK